MREVTEEFKEFLRKEARSARFGEYLGKPIYQEETDGNVYTFYKREASEDYIYTSSKTDAFNAKMERAQKKWKKRA